MDKLDIGGKGYNRDELNDYDELHGNGYGEGSLSGDGHGHGSGGYYIWGCGWSGDDNGDGFGYDNGHISDF